MERKVYRIVGEVQGVFFRKYTRQKARELQLKGYVKNMPDGSVKVLAEGEPDVLAKLESWLHQGSPSSRVSSVKVEPATEPIETFTSFEILF